MKKLISLFTALMFVLVQQGISFAAVEDYNVAGMIAYFKAGDNAVYPSHGAYLTDHSDVLFTINSYDSENLPAADGTWTLNKSSQGVTLAPAENGDTRNMAKAYPMVLKFDFTLPDTIDTNQINALSVSGSNLLEFYFGNTPAKWRMFLYNKTINVADDLGTVDAYAGANMNVTTVIDIENKTMDMKVVLTPKAGEARTYSHQITSEVMQNNFSAILTSVKNIKFLGMNGTKINKVEFGFIPTIAEVSSVSFDGTEKESGSTVSRTTESIAIKFTKPMKEETLSNIKLQRADGKEIACSASYDVSNYTYTLSDFSLQKKADYNIVIDENVQNALGTAMTTTRFNFKTDNSGASGEPGVVIADIPELEEGGTLTVTADVNGGDYDVETVEIFDNGTKINSDNAETASVSNVKAGMHNIIVKMVNAGGEVITKTKTVVVNKYITNGDVLSGSAGQSFTSKETAAIERMEIVYDFAYTDLTVNITGRIKTNGAWLSQAVFMINKSDNKLYVYDSAQNWIDLGVTSANTSYQIKATADYKNDIITVYYGGEEKSRINIPAASGSNVQDSFQRADIQSLVGDGTVTLTEKKASTVPENVKYNGADGGAVAPVNMLSAAVTFNKDLGAIEEGKVTLKDSLGNAVSFTNGTYDSASKTYSFNPSSVLKDNEYYTITFDGSISENLDKSETVTFLAQVPYRLSNEKVNADGSLEIMLTNNEVSPAEYTLIAVSYNKSTGALVDTASISGTMTAEKGITVLTADNPEFKLDNYESSTQNVKFMLWQSFETMIPLASASSPQ